MNIYISPSSQPENTYAGQNTNEQAQCNRIAREAKKHLEALGYNVKLAPEGQSYQRNVAESNAWGADIHLCIHTNAGGGKGTETLAYPSSVNNKYVQSVQAAIAAISFGNRGVKARTNLYEINSTRALCVYVEVDFHDNPEIAAWLVANPVAIGKAIADGIQKADGGTPTPAPSPAPTPAPTPTPTPSGKITTVRQVQAYVGTTQDGIFGPNTKRALVRRVQKIIGTTQDGYWGPKSSAAWGKTLVRQGSSGELTKLCQMMLICRGRTLPTYGADGIFGAESVGATMVYQRGVGLSVDGIIGKNTAWKLFS